MRGATAALAAKAGQGYNFNPRAPCGARRPRRPTRPPKWHFNPRAPYGARRLERCGQAARPGISIHAPHTGRDHIAVSAGGALHRISIHAPHTGRDAKKLRQEPEKDRFQSTRPIRGATVSAEQTEYNSLFQSTRPIRGATSVRISEVSQPFYFNPRAPYGARRSVKMLSLALCRISIHAPHTGRDAFICFPSPSTLINFNPRAPYGARR